MHRKRIVNAAIVAATLSLCPVALAGGGNCPSDVNNDGVTNVLDMLDLLAQWGTSNPDFDIAPAAAPDGIVNVLDLLELLSQWGDCPAPVNDDCANAILLTNFDSVPFSTSQATAGGPAHPGCLAGDDGQFHQDIWYKFVAPADGTLNVSTCDASYDCRIAVYRPGQFGGTCPGGVFGAILVGCSDNVCSVLQPSMTFPVTGGLSYTIRVGGTDGAAGPGNLNFNFARAGETCLNAIELPSTCSFSCFVSASGTTEGYGGSDVSTCGFGDTTDIWFRYTVSCNTVPLFTEFSTCNPGTDFDTTLTVYQGNCFNLQEIGCDDDDAASGCQLPSGLNRKSRILLPNLQEGTNYFVRVSGFNGAVGNFELTINTQCTPAD